MKEFKVDKATAELITDEIKAIGYPINDLKKTDADAVFQAVKAALTNIADGARKNPAEAG